MIKIDSGSDCSMCVCVCVFRMCVCVGNLLHLILNMCVCGQEVIICT